MLTKAEIVKSVDGLVGKSALGYCSQFKVVTYDISPGLYPPWGVSSEKWAYLARSGRI